LNCGTIVGFVDCTSISPSTAWTKVPISVVGGRTAVSQDVTHAGDFYSDGERRTLYASRRAKISLIATASSA
jgi:hypothetical protein